MISKSTIDQVFDAARVEEVIGDFVQLKKAGSNFKGLSPFSDERSPSFMVSPVKQIWKDFSSGKGGTSVSFLMEHEHFTYPEAIKYLAKKYNIEVEETEQSNEDKIQADARESMYLVSEFASSYFKNILLKTDKGQAIGKGYFKERGFTDMTIETFGLGYSLDEWQAFTDEALKKGYAIEYLEKTGLTIVKEEKRFDRFKGRVMFPIQSMSGRVLGFGGRILTSDKKAAKYLNSPESDIYQKSKILYGLYHAKQSIAKLDNCYLVEGYTDVIQFHQTGIKNVVSSSGTALTSDQIRLINRLTKNITVLFDGDEAGIRASLRGIDLILEQGMNVKVCTFPDGEDPDSFARKKTEQELRQYLENNAKDFIAYKASLLMKDAKNDPVKKAGLIRDMVTSISKIPDRIQTEIYIQECSRIMDISEEVLFSSLAQIKKKSFEEANKGFKKNQKVFDVVQRNEPVKKVNIQYELERKIIEILLLYGNKTEEFEDLVLKEADSGELILEPTIHKAKVFEKIYLDLQEDEMEFTNENFKVLYYTLVDTLNQNPDYALESFINLVDDKSASEITNILMNDERYSLHDWERKNIFPKDKSHSISQLVNETILSLRCFLIDQKVTEFRQATQDTKSSNKTILEDVLNYSNLKMLLSRKLNRVL
ncbi:DNA primase [Flavobacteriaceae bacterium]|nr:DNA primase [Bacteroidota bacterium]MDA9551445.1 DNA primase [Flavobacteriaceae bacterium]MDC0957159.1 DNA primase [Flavobacteriaceae bacterium]MDG1379764.1 DNA primase [Flavobacteriaceae bacterium]MDG2350494.1 DNA primase [Flavobacteriaceae bacterium]